MANPNRREILRLTGICGGALAAAFAAPRSARAGDGLAMLTAAIDKKLKDADEGAATALRSAQAQRAAIAKRAKRGTKLLKAADVHVERMQQLRSQVRDLKATVGKLAAQAGKC